MQEEEMKSVDPPPAPLMERAEFQHWSLYRAVIAEFVATLLFLYFTITTAIGNSQKDVLSGSCGGVGLIGVSWSFGAVICILVYCTAGISGGHMNPAITWAMLLTRRVTVPRAILYMLAQVAGAICGAGLVRAVQTAYFEQHGGGANLVMHGYTSGDALLAEVIGTFLLVYVVLQATDPKRSAVDSHVPVLAPLPIGLAVFVINLALIPITNASANPARSFGPAVIYNRTSVWDDQWIFWVAPLLGSSLAATYHKYIIRSRIKTLGLGDLNQDD